MTSSAGVTVASESVGVVSSVGELSVCCCPCVGEEVSLSTRHRATSSSSHAPESCDSLRRCPDDDADDSVLAGIKRIESTCTSGVVGALQVNDAALDGVALVSQAADTIASCGDDITVCGRDNSLTACDSES